MSLFTSTIIISSTSFTMWDMNNSRENVTRPPPPPPPLPKLTDIFRQFPEYQASLDLGLYGCLAQIFLGTITNFLTITVMMQRRLMTSTTCFYFTLLAVSDLMVLYFACLRRVLFVLYDHRDVYVLTERPCRLMDFFSYLSYDLSSWILTAMTVDRFIAVRFPLKAAIFSTRRKAAIVAAAILAVCIAKNILFLIIFETTELNGCLPQDEHEDFFENIWPWIDAASYSFVPFAMLLVFNALIIHCHRKAQKQNRLLHACGTRTFQGAQSTHIKHRLTTMLLAVSFTFIVLTAPKVILFIIREDVFSFILPNGRINFAEIARYSLISAIASFLMWTSHTINFFLYCLSGKRFRQEFVCMLRQCIQHQHHTQQVFNRGRTRQAENPTPRRDSSISILSDDVFPNPSQLSSGTEDALSRVNHWAKVTIGEKCSDE